tara:strand:- start:1336 stop:1524 length:189 start_codon:yes stop_codon:yes gene_type:complete
MSKQVGSDEKPFMFRKSMYGKSDTWGGKGARPRPGFYTKQYKDNWEKIFGKKSGEKNDKTED